MNKFARFSGTPDANERDIIDELERRGALVVVIDRPTDLVVGHNGTWTFCEIKTSPRARVRKSQKSFMQRCANKGLPCVLIDHIDDIDAWWPELPLSDDALATLMFS